MKLRLDLQTDIERQKIEESQRIGKAYEETKVNYLEILASGVIEKKSWATMEGFPL